MDQGQRHANGTEAKATTPSASKLANKRSWGGSERTVNDDEVDEFFVILKRLQEVKRLKNSAIVAASGNDDSNTRSRRCGAITWQPVFTLDDFKDVSISKDRIRRCNSNTGNARDDVEDNGNEIEVVSRSFDLNAEPEVDQSDELLIN